MAAAQVHLTTPHTHFAHMNAANLSPFACALVVCLWCSTVHFDRPCANCESQEKVEQMKKNGINPLVKLLGRGHEAVHVNAANALSEMCASSGRARTTALRPAFLSSGLAGRCVSAYYPSR